MSEDSDYKLDLISILEKEEEEKTLRKILKLYSEEREEDVEDIQLPDNLYSRSIYAEKE
ncbi:MAG: hypothetical protein QXG39_02250 [Candidatus Aenigmatarchaeota archaeon]